MILDLAKSCSHLKPKLDMLERSLFMAFVVTTNTFVAINMGWVFFMASWTNVLSGLVPVLSLATLASFLAFALLEDYLRYRRHDADGLGPRLASAVTH